MAVVLTAVMAWTNHEPWGGVSRAGDQDVEDSDSGAGWSDEHEAGCSFAGLSLSGDCRCNDQWW